MSVFPVPPTCPQMETLQALSGVWSTVNLLCEGLRFRIFFHFVAHIMLYNSLVEANATLGSTKTVAVCSMDTLHLVSIFLLMCVV